MIMIIFSLTTQTVVTTQLCETCVELSSNDGVAAWRRSGNNVRRIGEAIYRARLVPGCVTVFGRANHLGMQPATQANSASYPTRDGK